MTLKLLKSDFEGIADVANHCDTRKLDQAIREAQTFDLEELFCEFWNVIDTNWDDPKYQKLIDGGIYEGCKGNRTFAGVKKILAYYAYSRYIIINNFNDTPSGNVSKSNDFSIPKTIKEIEFMADKYRSMGYKEYQKAAAYLCKNKDSFEDFNDYECKPCGCNGICGSKTSVKGYGISGSIITKQI